MRRGDVWWASIEPRSGSEQRGERPVVIVSTDGFNRVPAWRSIIVVPCSTSISQLQRAPTVVALAAGSCGLTVDCAALAHQITTLDRGKLQRKVGELTAAQLAALEAAIRAAIDLPDSAAP